ncbi:MAG: hypothetical protein NTZ67_09510 [Gammaproteobacteria bacterium]|nr:hypothetical protein [Gammaproteobacteria bacterium]
MNENFIRDFSSIIEVSPQEMNDDFNLQNASEWDSIACLSTITLVDRHFRVLLSNDDFKSIRYFKDLNLAINRRLGL